MTVLRKKVRCPELENVNIVTSRRQVFGRVLKQCVDNELRSTRLDSFYQLTPNTHEGVHESDSKTLQHLSPAVASMRVLNPAIRRPCIAVVHTYL